MGQEARTEQAMRSSSGPAPTFEHTPEELIRRLRHTLMGSLAALRQPTEATETPLSANEAAYIAAALDVLEQLAASALPAAPLQVVPVELADVLMELLAQWKTAAPRHSRAPDR